MNKISIGDYVRTRWGCIAKLESINKGVYEFDNIIIDESSAVREELFADILKKSSPNKMDLIEMGDYVNGKLVIKVATDYIFDYSEEIKIIYFSENDYIYRNQDIKSVVTHEQFSQMEYRIGD